MALRGELGKPFVSLKDAASRCRKYRCEVEPRLHAKHRVSRRMRRKPNHTEAEVKKSRLSSPSHVAVSVEPNRTDVLSWLDSTMPSRTIPTTCRKWRLLQPTPHKKPPTYHYVNGSQMKKLLLPMYVKICDSSNDEQKYQP